MVMGSEENSLCWEWTPGLGKKSSRCMHDSPIDIEYLKLILKEENKRFSNFWQHCSTGNINTEHQIKYPFKNGHSIHN